MQTPAGILAGLATVAMLSVPLAAVASGDAGSHQRTAIAVTLGSTDGPLQSCGNIALLMTSETTGGPTWTSPLNGVITSWKHGAGPDPGALRLLVLKPSTVTPGGYAIVARSANETVAPGVFNTFSARVPIAAGQQLGLDIDAPGMFSCANVSHPTDVVAIQFNLDSSTASELVPNTGTTGIRLNLSAVVEPDVDHDGYGDISQDLCPESAATQAACPAPDVTITKAPKNKSTKRKAKITFSSTVAGSTFTCAVDKLPAAPCTSPFKKRFKYGKHTVVITATSPLGIVDTTPATVTFKVKKPKR